MPADDEQIKQRAYEIWENEGRPEGRELDHWQQAVQEFGEAGAQTGGDDDSLSQEQGSSGLESDLQPGGTTPGTGSGASTGGISTGTGGTSDADSGSVNND